MSHTRSTLFSILAALFLAATGPGLSAAESNTAESILAARLSELAQATMQGENMPTEAQWRQCASLLEGARRCDPEEVRYLQMLADALIHLNETDAAIEVVNAIRKLRPQDRGAQLQIVDLYASKMQTVDAKLNYLKGVVGSEAVPAEIRSVIAFQCWRLLLEKGQEQNAIALLDEAIRLNGLNFAALQARYQLLPPNASPAQRFGLLLAMLRANPSQPQALAIIAQDLARAGLVKESVHWYGLAFNVAQRTGESLPAMVWLDFASELYLADMNREAAAILDQLIARDAEDYPALILRSAIDTREAKPETATRFRVQARNALINRLATLRGKMGVQGAATRPVNEGTLPMPDLGRDPEVFKAEKNEPYRAAYLSALGDLAWFEVCFNKQPAEAERLLNLFTALADPNDKTAAAFAARTAGWIFLRQEARTAEAKVKLSAVADREPLAALGMIFTYGVGSIEEAKAKQAGAKVLAANPAGIRGALFYDALRDRGIKPAPNELAGPLLEALKTFPADWMKIVDNPAMFYSLWAEPVRISVSYGESMQARVTLRNNSNYDLTIGPDGVIPAGLWFDARVSGLPDPRGGFAQAQLTDIAFERITEQLILKPRQSITLIARLDRGTLLQLLRHHQNLAPPIAVKGTVRTNPVPLSPNTPALPGCYGVEFNQLMERASFRWTRPETFRAVLTGAASTNGAERMRNMELAGLLGLLLKQTKDNPDALAQSEAFFDTLRKARTDANPAIRAWASFIYARHFEAEAAPTIQRMLGDASWQCRLLGLAGLGAFDLDRQKSVLADFVKAEKEPFLKAHAAAVLEAIRQPPPKPQTPK